mmetsp:Transcript_6723/g.11978  ORF Transcript_6723/g.11978 Transcript_6723/m.11978 type:complete len:88 (-) Transcript_6723:1257-1520(-)
MPYSSVVCATMKQIPASMKVNVLKKAIVCVCMVPVEHFAKFHLLGMESAMTTSTMRNLSMMVVIAVRLPVMESNAESLLWTLCLDMI